MAIDLLQKARKYERLSEWHGALTARADLLLRMGQLQPSLADCNHNLLNAPKDDKLWSTKENIENALDHYDDDVASQTKALEHAPDSTEAMFGLSSTFHVVGRNQDALNAFQAILQRDPDHVSACSNLATILNDHGQHDQAKVFSQKSRHHRPSLCQRTVQSCPVPRCSWRNQTSRDHYH